MARKKSLPNLSPNSGITYTTYDNGRVTKATLNGVSANLNNAVFRITNQSKYIDALYYPYLSLPRTFTATAKLNILEDQPNPEFAQNLAHDRVMQKYHKAFDRGMVDVINDFHMTLARFYHYCDKKGIDISKCKSVEEFLAQLKQGT